MQRSKKHVHRDHKKKYFHSQNDQNAHLEIISFSTLCLLHIIHLNVKNNKTIQTNGDIKKKCEFMEYE